MGGSVFKTGQIAAENHLNRAGRAITMFCDHQLGQVVLGTILLVGIRAVNEHDDIGILFQAARFTQVGKDRFLIGTLFDSARKLGSGENRHIQFTRQHLEIARDVGHFLNPVVGAAITAHQL